MLRCLGLIDSLVDLVAPSSWVGVDLIDESGFAAGIGHRTFFFSGL
jgi:hypothetical protein